MRNKLFSSPQSLVCLGFCIFLTGELSSATARMGYFHALMRTWNIPIPNVTWPWIASTGAVVCIVAVAGAVAFSYWRPQRRFSFQACILLVLGFFAATGVVSYLAGRAAAYLIGDTQRVEIVDVAFGDIQQVAFFYRSDANDEVGVVLDPVTHKMVPRYFATPVINGKLNCDPIRIRPAHYSDIK